MNWDIVRAVAFTLTVVYGVSAFYGLIVPRRAEGGTWYSGNDLVRAIVALVLTLFSYVVTK